MTTQDVLNIVLITGFTIIVGCIATVSYYFIKALRSLTTLADNLEDTTRDVKFIKDRIKVGVLTVLSAFLTGIVSTFIKKRG